MNRIERLQRQNSLLSSSRFAQILLDFGTDIRVRCMSRNGVWRDYIRATVPYPPATNWATLTNNDTLTWIAWQIYWWFYAAQFPPEEQPKILTSDNRSLIARLATVRPRPCQKRKTISIIIDSLQIQKRKKLTKIVFEELLDREDGSMGRIYNTRKSILVQPHDSWIAAD